jgi:hypothetical protein
MSKRTVSPGANVREMVTVPGETGRVSPSTWIAAPSAHEGTRKVRVHEPVSLPTTRTSTEPDRG